MIRTGPPYRNLEAVECYRNEVSMINVLEMLEDTTDKYGSKPAFADSTMQVTYSETVALAQKIGSSLAADGIVRRAVAVLLPKGVTELVSFFGVVYSGNFYVPIDTDFSDAESYPGNRGQENVRCGSWQL